MKHIAILPLRKTPKGIPENKKKWLVDSIAGLRSNFF
jgi:hypothetical protein